MVAAHDVVFEIVGVLWIESLEVSEVGAGGEEYEDSLAMLDGCLTGCAGPSLLFVLFLDVLVEVVLAAVLFVALIAGEMLFRG